MTSNFIFAFGFVLGFGRDRHIATTLIKKGWQHLQNVWIAHEKRFELLTKLFNGQFSVHVPLRYIVVTLINLRSGLVLHELIKSYDEVLFETRLYMCLIQGKLKKTYDHP